MVIRGRSSFATTGSKDGEAAHRGSTSHREPAVAVAIATAVRRIGPFAGLQTFVGSSFEVAAPLKRLRVKLA
jgi:hypothetical protein